MTPFDIITVLCFFAFVIVYICFLRGNLDLLTKFLFACVALAAANQIGNAGHALAAAAIIACAVVYIVGITRRALK